MHRFHYRRMFSAAFEAENRASVDKEINILTARTDVQYYVYNCTQFCV